MTGPGSGDSRWEGRRRAREAALRMLYQAEVGRIGLIEAAALLGIVGGDDAITLDDEAQRYAVALAQGTAAAQAALDGHIADSARNWRIERVGLIERLLLRLAVHELLEHRGTPPRVVIDEAIELARAYSGDDAARFVNGVLDGIFKRLQDEGKVVD